MQWWKNWHSPKKISSNQLFSHFFRKSVTFTNFLPNSVKSAVNWFHEIFSTKNFSILSSDFTKYFSNQVIIKEGEFFVCRFKLSPKDHGCNLHNFRHHFVTMIWFHEIFSSQCGFLYFPPFLREWEFRNKYAKAKITHNFTKYFSVVFDPAIWPKISQLLRHVFTKAWLWSLFVNIVAVSLNFSTELSYLKWK